MKNTKEELGYLSWKCLDKFSNESKLFYRSNKKLSQTQLRDLNPIFKALRSKWIAEFHKEFGQERKYFTIASGNYSYFFILPDIVRLFQNRYPNTFMNLKLFEVRSSQDLANEFDILFLGIYKNIAGYDKRFAHLSQKGYQFSKGYYADEIYYGATYESIKQFGSIEAVSAKHNLLFGRAYKTNEPTTNERIDPPYSTAPIGRENDIPRVVTDQHLLSHIFMKHSVGIWTLFKSMEKDSSLCKLNEESASMINRYFLYRGTKNIDKRAIYVKTKVFQMLKYRRKT